MIKTKTVGSAALTVLAATVAALSATPAAAQNPTNSRIIPMDGASSCPARWDEGNGTSYRPALKHCYPRSNNESPMAYRWRSGPCIAGYGVEGSMWCVKGVITEPELARANAFQKRDLGDRCPAGFHSYKMSCSSDYAKTATYRWKGTADCKAGEIAEWGIWCTSNFEHLTAIQVSSAAARDWNNIYTATAKAPKQSPDSDYSEVYIHMFGQPKGKGSQASASSPAASTNESVPTPCATGEAGRAVGKLIGGKLGRKVAATGC